MTILRVHIAWWTPKATNTLSEYVIIIAFPLQQWLKARITLNVHCLSCCILPKFLIVTMFAVVKVQNYIS
jgi:hypothetical protein